MSEDGSIDALIEAAQLDRAKECAEYPFLTASGDQAQSEVRDIMRRDGIDPADPVQLRALVAGVVMMDYMNRLAEEEGFTTGFQSLMQMLASFVSQP